MAASAPSASSSSSMMLMARDASRSPRSPVGECRLVGDYSRYLDSFKTAVPTQRASLTIADTGVVQVWEFYRLGGEEDLSLNLDPVVFLPPESCGAEVFFLQIDALAAKGYKCIAAQHPPVYTIEEFVSGFGLFLDHIQARRCHLFGAGLGGYLAQTYAANCPRRVASLLLCNTFCETPYSGVGLGAGMVIGMLPSTTLKSIVGRNHIAERWEEQTGDVLDDPNLGPVIRKRNIYRRMVAESEAWVEGNLAHLSPELLKSKVCLAYAASSLPEVRTADHRVLVLECLDLKEYCETAVEGNTQLKERHPFAKFADQKIGGNYPYLCVPVETTVFLEVHLRNCDYFPQFDSPGPKPVLTGPAVDAAKQDMPPFALDQAGPALLANGSHGRRSSSENRFAGNTGWSPGAEAPDSPGDQQFEGDHMQQVPPTVATRSEHSIGARRIPRPQQEALFVDSPMTPATPSEPLPGERFESEHRPPVPFAARTPGGVRLEEGDEHEAVGAAPPKSSGFGAGRQHLQVQGFCHQLDSGALHEELEQGDSTVSAFVGAGVSSSGPGSSLMACSPNPRYREVAKAPPSPLQQPSRGNANGINGTSSSTNKKSGWCIGQTTSSVQRREQHEPKSTASSQPPSGPFVPPPRPPPHQQFRKNAVRGQNPSSASAARVELQKEGSHGHSHSTTEPVRAPQGSAAPVRLAAATAPNTSRGPGPANPNATNTLLAALRQGRLKERGGEECADAGGGRENEQKLKSSAPQPGDVGKAKVEAAASSSSRGTLAGGLGSPSHLDENARKRKQKKKR